MKNRVAGIPSPVISDNVSILIFLTQKIGHLALSGISVLQVNNDIEFGHCAPGWTRTIDTSLKRRVLYQLSYGRKLLFNFLFKDHLHLNLV